MFDSVCYFILVVLPAQRFFSPLCFLLTATITNMYITILGGGRISTTPSFWLLLEKSEDVATRGILVSLWSCQRRPRRQHVHSLACHSVLHSVVPRFRGQESVAVYNFLSAIVFLRSDHFTHLFYILGPCRKIHL